MTLVVAQRSMSVETDTPSSHSRTCLRCVKARISGVVEVAEAEVDPVDVSTSLALLWMDSMGPEQWPLCKLAIEFWLLFGRVEVWFVLRTCRIIVIGRGFDELRGE